MLHEEKEIAAELADDSRCLNQRSPALIQRDHWCVFRDWQESAIAAYHAMLSHAPA